MSLVAMLEAIVTAVDSEVPSLKMVVPYDGRFSDVDLQRFQADAPCVLVSCLGYGETEDQGDDIVAPAQWAMSLITTRTTGDALDASRLKAVMALASTLTVLVRDSNGTDGAWADESAGPATAIRAANVHSQSLDARGLTMWMLTWTQDCSLVAFDNDALDDLLSIVSTDDDGTETGVEIVRTTELEGATP
jgi:hypothetical protein